MEKLVRELRVVSVVSLLLLSSLRSTPAQPGEVDPDLLPTLRAEALEAARGTNSRKCVAALQRLTSVLPQDGASWFQLGTCRKRLLHWKRAALAFQQAFDLSHRPSDSAYEVALAQGWRSQTSAALEWLQRAAALGFDRPAEASRTAAFKTARETSEFDEILEMMRANRSPCQHQEQYRALDFWIGDWRVFSLRGDAVGHSRIRKTAAGCSLTETWSSVSGAGGSSLAYLHPGGGWKYLWVDSRGAVIDAGGGPESGSVIFLGTRSLLGGGKEHCRIQLKPLPDGRVHHLIQRSPDGTSWQTWFDALYVREVQEQTADQD